MTSAPVPRPVARIARGLRIAILAVVALTLVWWAVGRITVDSRRFTVHRVEEDVGAVASSGGGQGVAPNRIRVLTWNIAHGRGDVGLGVFRNFRGGSEEERQARLARIATVIRRVDADVVVLNEADFDAVWSGGVNHAEVLARAAGYPTWIQQINYDLRLPFATLSFGNAVLTRIPYRDGRWLRLPPHARWEAWVAGAKAASLVRLMAPGGPVTLVPIHLEPRTSETRRSSAGVIQEAVAGEEAPVILAGDFNSSPPGWPDMAGGTAVGDLMEAGWRSPRVAAPPERSEWTYPTYGLRRAIDWILVRPPLRVVETGIVEGTSELSDHLPILSVVELPGGASP